jgi:hypothetical protein
MMVAMKNKKTQTLGLIFSCLVLIELVSVSCTTLKMASLFMSGEIEKKNFLIEIPLRFQQGLLHLEVRLNDKEPLRRFVFDTGAAFCVVSPELAADLGLRSVVSDTAADSAGHRNKVDFVILESVEIAGLSFRRIPAAVVDLKNSKALRCYDFEGVIGVNLIRLAEAWQVDYRGEKLRLSDQAKNLAGAGSFYRLSLRRNIQRIPEVEVRFFENRSLWLEIDTGSTRGFSLNSKEWRKLEKGKQEIPWVLKRGISSAGAFGVNSAESHVVKIDRLQLGAFRAGTQLAEYNPNFKSHVGNDFWRNFRLTFNWPKNELCLEPLTPEPEPAELVTFGFGFDYDQEQKGLRVSLLYENSSDFKTGLELGDRIISIAGKNLESVSQDEYCRVKADPNVLFGDLQEVRIVVRREREDKEFVLKKTRLLY